MDVKTIFKQHGLTILSAAAVLALVLPFISVTASVEILGSSGQSETVTTGFGAIGTTLLGLGLIVGPVLLVAMNYIKQLEKYKGLLAMGVPVLCLLIEVITFFIAKGASAAASAGGGAVNAEVSASMGIGFFVLILIYLGMIVSGAVLYFNFTFDKQGLERLKSEGADIFGNSFEKIKEGGANIINSASEKISNMQDGAVKNTADGTQKPQKKTLNYNKVEEVLSLIEKLADMKEKGILTEEEFAEKKKELLEEI